MNNLSIGINHLFFYFVAGDYKYVRDHSEEAIVERFLEEERIEESEKMKILDIIRKMGMFLLVIALSFFPFYCYIRAEMFAILHEMLHLMILKKILKL
ncbi:hypothetical protein ACHQM5_008066 [Ranunculus cassubicifolius]